MAKVHLDELDPPSAHRSKPSIDQDAASESKKNEPPPAETETFTDPSTSGGATAEDQDSATGQHTA